MPGFLHRLLVALLAGLLSAACSGGDNAEPPSGAPREGDPPAEAPAAKIAVVAAEVQAMAPQAPPFPEDVKTAVQERLDAYLGDGLLAPLETGEPPAGIDALFTPAALARLQASPPDKAAVLEEGATLSGEVRRDRASAKLTALTGPGGEVVLVTAQLDVALTVETGGRKVAVIRSGELVLVPDGGWRIDAFDLRTARDTQPEGAK